MAIQDLTLATEVVLNPLVTLWNSFVNTLPGILAAIIILVLGYFVAFLVGHALKTLLEKLGLSKWLYKSSFSKAIGRTNVSAFLGEILKWYIFIIFLQVAVELLELGTLSSLLQAFVMWLPNVIAAIIILFVGIALAYYLEMKIKEHTSMKGIPLVGKVAKLIVLVIVSIIALEQIGIKVSLLENVFLVTIATIGLGVALAIGIGFGLGLKGNAGKMFENLKKKL